jgi:hypothetical protein
MDGETDTIISSTIIHPLRGWGDGYNINIYNNSSSTRMLEGDHNLCHHKSSSVRMGKRIQ